ncbi:MAG TPA: sugar phosphate nucleotidyltransferase [Cyclobacteriaceae bacterium]|nr:sugar phosphate nucleotidyltransferase [Cyclobacteriaceae bacterium]
MKVVLFCGGQGLRLRDYSDKIPKPLVPVGNKPILWHIMKYYAHFGHRDFILCLGYQGDPIKDYFLNYDRHVSNDFILKRGGKIDLMSNDIENWNITFVETGFNSNIAERLSRVKEYLKDEEIFLANYADGLTDMPLPTMINKFKNLDKVAMMMTARPTHSMKMTIINDSDEVTDIQDLSNLDIWINAGYFIFTKDIFNYIDTSEDLPVKTFPRLVEENQLAAFPYDGVFLTMDTYREKERLDDMYANGETPWQVWNNSLLNRFQPSKNLA